MKYLRDRNDGRSMKDSFLVGEHACAVILFADLRDAEDAVPRYDPFWLTDIFFVRLYFSFHSRFRLSLERS